MVGYGVSALHALTRVSALHVFIAASSGFGLFLSPDPQFGTHCLMICVIQLRILYNLGGT